jgi:hypothetical protein
MIHRRTGVVQTAFNRLIAREAEVRKVESVGEDFRLVTLAGEDLENRSWTPGDMVQIAFAGWESRSFRTLVRSSGSLGLGVDFYSRP